MNSMVRILLACMLATTGALGVMSIGVMATDTTDLLEEIERSEDPGAFFDGLAEANQSTLVEYLAKKVEVKKVVTVTEGGDRSSKSVEVEVNAYFQGANVWRHILKVSWYYDGEIVWGVRNTDSYYGWGVGAFTWVKHCIHDYKDYGPDEEYCDCWSNAHWEVKYYLIKIYDEYNTIAITVYGDGSYNVW